VFRRYTFTVGNEPHDYQLTVTAYSLEAATRLARALAGPKFRGLA
jgi:hypothetical protein